MAMLVFERPILRMNFLTTAFLKEYVSPLVPDADTLAFRLTCHRFNEIMEGRRFSLIDLDRNPSREWWRWVLLGADDGHAKHCLHHLTRVAPVSAIRWVLRLSPIENLPVSVTADMCLGAAERGSLTVLRFIRGHCYSNWKEGAIAAARKNNLGVLKHLLALGDLYSVPGDETRYNERMGLTIGIASNDNIVRWALDGEGLFEEYDGLVCDDTLYILAGLVIAERIDLLSDEVEDFGGVVAASLLGVAIAYGCFQSYTYLVDLGTIHLTTSTMNPIHAIPAGVTTGFIERTLGVVPNEEGKRAIMRDWLGRGFQINDKENCDNLFFI